MREHFVNHYMIHYVKPARTLELYAFLNGVRAGVDLYTSTEDLGLIISQSSEQRPDFIAEPRMKYTG
jgi:hypothetical protein